MYNPSLIWRLIIPVTIISFGVFTRWWLVDVIDAPDTMMAGFPLPFVSDGWHTSMSLQIFLFEFLVDILFYFLIWLLLINLIDRYVFLIKVTVPLTGVLWCLAALTFSVSVIIASSPENIFALKRDWAMKVVRSGFKLTWTYQDR